MLYIKGLKGIFFFCLIKPAITCSKLEHWLHWRYSGVFIVEFEHISHLVQVFLLLTLSRKIPDGILNKMRFAPFTRILIKKNCMKQLRKKSSKNTLCGIPRTRKKGSPLLL